MNWEPIIGLEIHAQLATKSKIFSGASTSYGGPANSRACAIDLALPGVLPVLNREVLKMAIMFGVAIDAEISRNSVFARKNYFYPDLPKGYQISQFELPIVTNGQITINTREGTPKKIRVTRAHLEEDAGKSIHDKFASESGIDLNRAGIPLLEIVSEPDLSSADEATTYMRKIHTLVQFLGICDGNMEKGSFRCDANVSVRPVGTSTLGTRTEIKNLNSFRYIEKAITHEVERQIECLEHGNAVVQETRLYDASKDITRPMRSKEAANDYRYFPDPDLLPVRITDADIDHARENLPELPEAILERFITKYGLDSQDASILILSPDIARYFEETMQLLGDEAKLVLNWLTGTVSAKLNSERLSFHDLPISPIRLAGLLQRVVDNTISANIAKQVFAIMWTTNLSADDIIDRQSLRQVTDQTTIDKLVIQVIEENPIQTQQYREGKTKVMSYLVGAVMKLSNGKANPKQVNELLHSKLDR